MPERFSSPTRVRRPARLAVAALGLAALGLSARTTLTSLEWVGRLFPGFLLLEDRVVPAVGLPHWSSAGAPSLFLTQITAVDGRPVAEEQEIYAAAAARPVGTPITYRVRRGGLEREVVLATQRFTAADWGWLFGIYLLNGVVFAVSGLLVWALRPVTPLTAAFLAFALSFATFILTSMDLYAPATFLHLYLASNALLSATALQLALLFPEPHRWARWRFAAYPVALAVFVAYEVFLQQPEVSTTVFAANTALLGAVGLFFGGRLLRALQAGGSPLVRQRVRVVALGTLVGLSVPGLILLLSLVFRSAFAQNAALFALPMFPLTLAYAIAKHDLFEIDAMVKRGATYLLLSGSVSAVYVAAVAIFNRVLQVGAVSQSPLFPIIFTLAVLLVFSPLRQRVQAFVDRVFFRTHYDGAEVLADVGARLAGARRRQDILALVAERIEAAIPNAGVRVLLPGREDGRIGVGSEMTALLGELSAGRVATVFDPPEAYIDPTACAPARAALAAEAFEIAVPMLQGERLVGVLGLGAKRSGLFYTAGDAEFLRAVAQNAAIALDNATAYEALEGLNAELETRVLDRTAALAASNQQLERAFADLKQAEVQLVQSEKLASLGRLAAGVAHEINNPVSFIASNVPPLQQRLERMTEAVPESIRGVLEEARELVDIMGRGAARTAAIVRDLRSFSRVGEAPRKPIDLHEAIDVAVRLLEPRWRDRIVITRTYGVLPPVECDAGQMNQVFMNLLSNACDAIGARGAIEIRTAVEGSTVLVEIHDDGCGVAAERLPHLFEPFYTTKDVGAGTGLGLAIVHGIITAHGGDIRVESTVGRGTMMRVSLPTAVA
jgi:signal transduction histidine kinase